MQELSIINKSVKKAIEIARLEDAIESKVFYNNKVTEGIWAKKYFPYPRFKAKDTLISLPMYSEIVNRIVSTLRSDVSYIGETDAETQSINELNKKWLIKENVTKAIGWAIENGNSSIWIHNNGLKTIQPWYSYMLSLYGEKLNISQAYNLKDGEKLSVNQVSSTENLHIEIIDETFWTIYRNGKILNQIEHMMPFVPAVWFSNTDRYELAPHYGKPYLERFKTLMIALNDVISFANKQILTTPVMWYTNRSEDPDEKAEIVPGRMNYMQGNDSAVIAQTERKLDLKHEEVWTKKYETQIYKSAQLPETEQILANKDYVSGVALGILYTPFIKLLDQFVNAYKDLEAELISKVSFVEANSQDAILRNQIPQENIKVVYNLDNILPANKTEEFAFDSMLVEKGIRTQEWLEEKWSD